MYVDALAAGIIGMILVILFLIIPKIGFSIFQKLFYQQRYHTATNLISVLSWLHPFDSWLEKSKLTYSLALAKDGKLEQSLKILKTSKKEHYYAKILTFYVQGDWKNGLNWMTSHIPAHILFNEPDLLIYYLRALGETGNLNKLLKLLEKTELFLERNGSYLQVYLVRMYALAFCGQVLQVRQLLQVPLKKLPNSVQQFWLVTAQMVAGKKAYSYQNLSEIFTEKNLILKKAIDWRLDHPQIEPEKILEQESYRIINRIKLEVDQEFYPRIFSFQKHRKAYATYLLIGINLAFFGIQIETGGSENLQRLYQLGALVPEAVLAGQWWRVITANFLHFGLLHLLTNMFSLYVLGRFVEKIIGFFRYIFIYLFSGIGSMSIYTALSLQAKQQNYILMGASAAIMGLLGALFIIFVKEWFQTKSRITAKRIQLILFTIGLQFTFDYFVPHISISSHFWGLVLGLVSSIFLVGKVGR
ncbi:rhomboid family intramembrane serine protease [Aphanothece hegewaldii]|nr:rhomboid family intramembrane serine protease [Aphanothece hegewaldii]